MLERVKLKPLQFISMQQKPDTAALTVGMHAFICCHLLCVPAPLSVVSRNKKRKCKKKLIMKIKEIVLPQHPIPIIIINIIQCLYFVCQASRSLEWIDKLIFLYFIIFTLVLLNWNHFHSNDRKIIFHHVFKNPWAITNSIYHAVYVCVCVCSGDKNISHPSLVAVEHTEPAKKKKIITNHPTHRYQFKR